MSSSINLADYGSPALQRPMETDNRAAMQFVFFFFLANTVSSAGNGDTAAAANRRYAARNACVSVHSREELLSHLRDVNRADELSGSKIACLHARFSLLASIQAGRRSAFH